jgi:hypothetical protein
LRLNAGQEARVEEYLACFPELTGERQTVLGLIAAEQRLRARDTGLDLDDYFRRFPRFSRRTGRAVADAPPAARCRARAGFAADDRRPASRADPRRTGTRAPPV